MAEEQEDRRASEDRRKEDRRTQERRSGDAGEYEGEERRKGERRESDRRAGERRAAERKNLKKIAIYGLVGTLVPIGILMLLSQLAPPVKKRSGARKLEVDTMKVEAPARETTTRPIRQKRPEKTGVERLRDDLLNLAPDLYHGVKLESLISKTDPTAVDSTASVEAIEFLVKGKKWDTMGGTDKIVILNKTFSFLKKRFPYLTRTVRLIFDDGRPDLDLKFE